MAPLLADLDPSIVPARTADPAEAARLMREHGACVLTGLGSGQAAADGLARLVLGDRVVAAPESIAVREGGDKDRKVREEAAHEVPLPMHTDGFTYGHDAPDAMFLLCDVDSAIGGDSVLIDDYAVLAGLRAEPAGSAGARLAEFVTGTVLDLTSPGMVPRSGTMVRPTPAGRPIFWLGALRDCMRPMADDPDPAATDARFDEITDAVRAAPAPRPTVPGRARRGRLRRQLPGVALPGRLRRPRSPLLAGVGVERRSPRRPRRQARLRHPVRPRLTDRPPL